MINEQDKVTLTEKRQSGSKHNSWQKKYTLNETIVIGSYRHNMISIYKIWLEVIKLVKSHM